MQTADREGFGNGEKGRGGNCAASISRSVIVYTIKYIELILIGRFPVVHDHILCNLQFFNLSPESADVEGQKVRSDVL
jgi:hypothetical protein